MAGAGADVSVDEMEVEDFEAADVAVVRLRVGETDFLFDWTSPFVYARFIFGMLAFLRARARVRDIAFKLPQPDDVFSGRPFWGDGVLVLEETVVGERIEAVGDSLGYGSLERKLGCVVVVAFEDRTDVDRVDADMEEGGVKVSTERGGRLLVRLGRVLRRGCDLEDVMDWCRSFCKVLRAYDAGDWW